MQRTNILELKPNKKQEKILKEMMLLSSSVYNMANYKVRQQFFKGEKVFGAFDLQKELQKEPDYQRLGRSYSLPRIHVYSETNSARFKLIKSKTQKEVGLPKYYKNRKTNTTIPSYLVIDNQGYHVGKLKVNIPLSKKLRKEYGLKHFSIKYNGLPKWKGKQSRGQIKYKNNKFYFYQSVKVKDTERNQSKITAGIDLGIKRLFAIKISNKEDKIIGSNRHFKQWSHYGKLIAEEQSRLSEINRKSSKKLNRLFELRTKWQQNLYNNLINKLFKVLRRNNVSTVFVGDVKHIRENNNLGRKGNKMLHNYWAYDSIYHKMQNKAEEYGIGLVRQTESYTSQTCPCCGVHDSKNKKDRIFLCEFCGYFEHRDIVGATNILFNGLCSQIESTHQGETALSEGVSNATI